ncbi:MAG: M23 family metallopeptidase [Opitutaceae bacterium]|nr:M23 family metallopeptidase [Opitutaceae bacterium]
MMRELLLVVVLAIPGLSLAGEKLQPVWPAPHPAWAQGKPSNAFLQEAGSGDPASGGFGGVRSGGRQFHEGIDIKALRHDRRGEAADEVVAALDGVVRHISSVPGKSSYGRYIVLEHPDQQPAVYTLYAHLASIASGIRPGVNVRAGQALGIMGRSASGYAIPQARAHLHFEIGLRLSDEFQSWYDWKKFGSRNEHGVYNGMNLLGTDPLAFFNAYRADQIKTMGDWFARMQPAVKLRIATRRTPDFVRRYPALVSGKLPMLAAGWEIECDWTGLPFRWTPLGASEIQGLRPNEVRVIEVNQALLKREKSKDLVIRRGGRWEPVDDLRTVLQLVFGLR